MFTPAAMAAQGIADPMLVMKRAALAGLCFHAYQQVCAAAAAAVHDKRSQRHGGCSWPMRRAKGMSMLCESCMAWCSRNPSPFVCSPPPLRHPAGLLHDPAVLTQPPSIMLPLQVSYMILQRVSPVTHSIGNSVKRVVVIASSILVFRNPVTQQVRCNN